MDRLLRVQDLRVSYRSVESGSLCALNDVSLDMFVGETIGVLGESGCGKTTLALTLLKLLPSAATIQHGSVEFCGTNLLKLPERILQKLRGARIAMVHQEPGTVLNPVLRIGEQISEVLRAHRSISHRRALDESKNLLVEVGFTCESRIWEAFPHQLSGGQQQRVAIAQAIACRPSLLIADEPTTALDSVTEQEILALLKKLKKQFGLSIILISHVPGLLAGFVDRILVMYAGRVIEEGRPAEVLEQPLHPYTKALLRCRVDGLVEYHRKILAAIPGDSPNLAHLPAGCSFEERCPDRMEVCRTCVPTGFPVGDGRQSACFKYAP